MAEVATVAEGTGGEIVAEFREVIKQMKRMCAHFIPTCNGCPLCLEKGTNEFCGERPLDIRSDPALVEAAVMAWAAEHPEPVYPTWGEWLESEGICFSRLTNYEHVHGFTIPQVFEYQIDGKTAFICGDRVNNPIPADIAEKLGIEPKEG